MATQGPYYPANIANGAGSNPWTNPTNVGVEDGTYATSPAGVISNQLIALDFGFTIPDDSTIDGILVEIKRGATLNTAPEHIEDYELFMEEDGSFNLNFAAVGNWDASVGWYSYGGPTNLLGIDDYLGESFATPDDVNYELWGVSIRVNGTGVSAQALVDAVRITVYYTPPAPPTYILTDFAERQDRALALLVQPDGKVILGGFSYDENFDYNRDFALARYLSDGTLDTTFGTGGKVITTLFQPGAVVSTTATTPIVVETAEPHGLSDGDVVTIAGCVNNTVSPGPFPATGANGTFTIDVLSATTFALPAPQLPGIGQPGGPEPDATWIRFGNASTLEGRGGNGSGFQAMTLQDDGKIVTVGYIEASTASSTAQSAQLLLIRYNADGSLDTDFGAGGVVMTSYGYATHGHAVALQADGKILIGGLVYPAVIASAFVARFNTDGSPDTGFGAAGATIIDWGAIFGYGYDTWDNCFVVAVRPTGEILFGGDFRPGNYEYSNDRFYLAQLDSDGVLDTGFGTDDGMTPFEMGLAPDLRMRSNPFAIHLYDDGKVLLGGWYTTDDFVQYMALVMFNADGTVDTSFGEHPGWTDTNIDGLSEIYALAVQDDGKILAAAGGFGGGTKVIVGRYDADGILDAGFGVGGISTEILNSVQATSIAVLASGNIVVGGWANEFPIVDTDDFYLRMLDSSGEQIPFAGDEFLLVDCVATATVTCALSLAQHFACDCTAIATLTCDVNNISPACIHVWTSCTIDEIPWTSGC